MVEEKKIEESIEFENGLTAFQKGLKSLLKREKNILQNLSENQKFLDVRQKGELLKCNLDKIHKSISLIELDNIYVEPPITIKIALDKTKNAIENMEAYFDKARKMEHSIPIEKERLNEVTSLIEEVKKSIIEFEKNKELVWGFKKLEYFGFKKFLPITQEKKQIKKKDKADPLAKIKKYLSCDGFWIYVGGDATENEMVTFKVGSGKDGWLHVAHVPGSHVVVKLNIKGEEIPKATLGEAAVLAVHFSKLRGGANIPVTCTLVHNVKKVKGAPIGTVQAYFTKTIKASDSKEVFQKIMQRTHEKQCE